MPLTTKEQDRRAALAALAAGHGVADELGESQFWALADLAPHLPHVPPRMHGGLVRYLLVGTRPGHFLCALLANDLLETLKAADDENTVRLRAWGHLLYDGLPAQAHGSAALRDAWIDAGGAAGVPGESLAA